VKVAIAGMFLAVVVVAGSAIAATGTTEPAPSSDAPTIVVVDEKFPDDAVARGSTFKVQGTGWAPNALIELEVCGNHADSGTSDCSVGTSVVVASNDSGAFNGRLSLVLPPTPCPCVVRAVSQNSSVSATASVTIPGAQTAHAGDGTVVQPALRKLDIEHVALIGSDSLTTWLGGRATRRLEFEVVNHGTIAVNGASLDFVQGPKGNPTGFVPPLKLDRFEVGERRKIVVPIRFDALAFGDQSVRGSVRGTSVPVSFTVTTSTHPWLLILVPIVVIGQLILLSVRNRLRRRLHDRLAGDEADDAGPHVPTDDALICVVEIVEPDPEADPDVEQPALRHHTMVVRSMAAVQRLVLETLEVPEATEEPTPSEAGTVAVLRRPVDSRLINTITVLADADLRVGDAYAACDMLCAWVEATFAESAHPAARSLTLRRHVGASGAAPAPGAQLGMVPLGVLVRTSQVRADARH